MLRDTIEQVRTAVKPFTNPTIAWSEQKRLKSEIEGLKSDKQWLKSQNDALKQEISRMVASAMRAHWDSIKNLHFQLDGFRFEDKTYLATISPTFHADLLRLPWRTNFALLFRWGFMQIFPQDVFNKLITVAVVTEAPQGGVGVNKSPGIDKNNIEEMAKDVKQAAEIVKNKRSRAKK